MSTRYSPPSANEESKREYTLKVVIIGEMATGKTNVIRRYVHNMFTDRYRTTIGADFALKIIKIDDDTTVRLHLWDIAGQERFGSMMRDYYKDAVGSIIVYDVSRRSTFDAVSKWKTDLDNKVQLPDESPLPCILLANKCDLPKDDSINNAEQIDTFCREKGFLKWFETSAKENINIEKSIQYLIDEMIKHVGERERSDQEPPIKLHDPSKRKQSNSGRCSCGKS